MNDYIEISEEYEIETKIKEEKTNPIQSTSSLHTLLLIANKTTKEIAEQLNISEKTVRNHISNAMQKLSVKGRAQAVVELLRLNEITL